MQHQLARSVQNEMPQGHTVSSHQTTSSGATVHPLLKLQRQVGNQVVRQLIQAKLKFSQPTDSHEQEADRTAAEVVSGSSRVELRNCISDSAGCDTGVINRTVEVAPAAASAHLPGAVLNSLGQGRALEPTTRAFMESRFGCDFGRVRLHTDERAASLAESLNARAFTVSPDIVFGANEYAPQTAEGGRLLAHELAHTIQQSSADHPPGVISRQELPASGAPQITPVADAGVAQESSIVQSVIDALSQPSPVAGIGDYETAWSILNGLSMADLLFTLTQLDDQRYLEVLLSNTAPASRLGESKLMTAVRVVRFYRTKGAGATMEDYVDLVRQVSRLTGDQQEGIIAYLSASSGLSEEEAEIFAEGFQGMIQSAKQPEKQEQGAEPEQSTEPYSQQPMVAAGTVLGPGLWNRPGKMPVPFYMGITAHLGIAAYYVAAHASHVVFTNSIPVSSILTQLPWLVVVPNTGALSARELAAKPDILNLTAQHLYEIKPEGSESLALSEAKWYVGIFAKARILISLGPSGEPGTSGFFYDAGHYFAFWSPMPGVIVYQFGRRLPERRRVPQTGEEPERYEWRIRWPQVSPQAVQVGAEVAVGAMLLYLLVNYWWTPALAL